MKRAFFLSLTVFLIAMLALPEAGYCRRRSGNLYDTLSEKAAVKTYVAEVTDSTGEAKADRVALRKTLEDTLMTRMTINFEIVSKPADADIVVSCDIIEYFWTDKDPVDNITGTVAIAWDAINKQNYARMTAIFTVTDAKDNKVLWEKRIKATITDEFVTADESVGMINRRITKIFMRDAFSKKRGRRSGIM